jgi:hypothetical protein
VRVPGELVHIDIKKLARFHRPGHRLLGRGPGRFETAAGYEYLHVCVDDHSRLAYAELLADERAESAVAFLRRALGFFAARGLRCERVLTDNGSAFIAHRYRHACHALGLRHTRTRPRRPRTNGKAERFIQTLLNDWAYGRLYADSDERARALPLWLSYYNYRRPHGSLGHQPPSSRLNVPRNYNWSRANTRRSLISRGRVAQRKRVGGVQLAARPFPVRRRFVSRATSFGVWMLFFDHEVVRVPLDDPLDLGFVARHNGKVGRGGAQRLVLAQGHRDLLRTASVGALAAEVDPVAGVARDELLGDLGHALVHLPEEGFVRGEALLPRSHGGDCLPQRPTAQG